MFELLSPVEVEADVDAQVFRGLGGWDDFGIVRDVGIGREMISVEF